MLNWVLVSLVYAQIHPDVVEGLTTRGDLFDDEANVIGTLVLDRTEAPTAASPFGRMTDSWSWTGDEWPSGGFTLRLSSDAAVVPAGDYTTWSDLAFTSTTTAPPTSSRYAIERVNADDTRTLLGELLVEENEGQWRQTWWTQGDVLVNARIPFAVDVDYAFVPVTGETALDADDLYIVELGYVSAATLER